MESINIDIKGKRKRFTLNGDENKVIEFNPESTETRRKFYNASQKVFEKQRELDLEIKNTNNDDIEKVFELEEKTFRFMKEIIDEIFGTGVTDMITDGETNIYAITNFLIAIAPYFENVAERQKNKYTDNLKNVGLI